MESFLRRIKKEDILVADGAIGSMLIASGLSRGTCPESYNLSNIELLRKIAGSYKEAGADIIQTNTFGASPINLGKYSLEGKTEEINRNAVSAVRDVVGTSVYISASCGPCGKILKPYGDTDPEEVYKSFYTQLKILIDSAVDIICIETMSDVGEAVLAVRAARNISSTIPVMAAMTFEKTKRGFYTIMGVNIARAAQELEDAGADVIGTNCGNGIENMILIAKEFKEHSKLPLIIQANAGLPVIKGESCVYPETPDFMAQKSKQFIDLGVAVIGGCCGTTPEHTYALRQLVDSINFSSN